MDNGLLILLTVPDGIETAILIYELGSAYRLLTVPDGIETDVSAGFSYYDTNF